MATKTIPVDACSKMVESATRSCQPLIATAPEPANTTADSLAALSTAFTFGSILLAVIALFGAIAWGFFVKAWAEKEAREEAERCTKKWIEEEGFPMLRREMQEWKKTFPLEAPISDTDIGDLVAAAGADGKENDDGKK
ncbi:MAG: hypothetical protein ACREB7_19585 [Sphingopyxis sp.]|uniref:hypothetical protein n=1 Tax=Sphingopyxis sp. TaxID=1908224 RepID=UPI003D6CA2ED